MISLSTEELQGEAKISPLYIWCVRFKEQKRKKKKKNTNTQNTSFQKDAIYKRDSPLQYFNNKNPANFKISGF